jgi:protein-L-isoaspartate(D-aspartate) O-methyltransferase
MVASVAELPSQNPLVLEAAPEAVEAAAFVLGLRARGIRDSGILGAMERVPRELFAPTRFADLSRTDVALPLPCGQTMTAPGVIATMLVALGASDGQRVLEIGTGSGYVTALLAKLGCSVHSVERYATLADSAAARLGIAGLGGAVKLFVGDGLSPAAEPARFDRVLINGALASLPAHLSSLMSPGGRLVAALIVDGVPRLLTVERSDDGALTQDIGPALRLGGLAQGTAAFL